jgi:hypothetical protein
LERPRARTGASWRPAKRESGAPAAAEEAAREVGEVVQDLAVAVAVQQGPEPRARLGMGFDLPALVAELGREPAGIEPLLALAAAASRR